MVVLHPAEMQKACKILWRKQIYSTNNAFFLVNMQRRG